MFSLYKVEVLDSDHLARQAVINSIKTPAMSIVINNKLRIFETFRNMNEGKYVEVSKEEITHLPHIIPQYRNDVVKKVMKNFINDLDKSEIIALSYYKDPTIYDPLKEVEPKMVFVKDIPAKISLKGIIEFFLHLRETLSWETIILVLSYIEWKFIPYLTYMGVDIIDVGPYEIKVLKSGLNAVIGYGTPLLIGSFTGDISDKKFLIEANRAVLDELFKKIRNSISRGKLREVLETYSHLDQETDALLAFLDNQYKKYFVKRVSLSKPKVNLFIGSESFRRPIVKWYFDRFSERYDPPETPEIIVLFPCAARKPYSLSKSHKLFKEALNQGGGGLIYLIHEVMLTSPIGVVPRELEFSYPNAHYDTTTTGNWSIEEIEHTATMLEVYLRKKLARSPNLDIIVHLEGGYKEAALRALERLGLDFVVTTMEKHPTDTEALNFLSKTVSERLEKVKSIDPTLRRKRIMEDAKSILSYQFGERIAKEFLETSTIEGSLFSQKGFTIKNYAVFDKEIGFFLPLKNGAQIILEKKRYYAIIALNEILDQEYVYASDVVDIDRDLHPGELVAIGNESLEPLGVGITLFSGEDIKKSSHSKAIRIIRKYR